MTNRPWMWPAVAVVALLAGVGIGYVVGQNSQAESEDAAAIWTEDSAVIARRAVTLRGEVSEVTDGTLLLQAAGEDGAEAFAVTVNNETKIYLTLQTDEGTEAPELVTIEELKQGDRVDAVIEVQADGTQDTVSVAAWRTE